MGYRPRAPLRAFAPAFLFVIVADERCADARYAIGLRGRAAIHEYIADDARLAGGNKADCINRRFPKGRGYGHSRRSPAGRTPAI